MAYPVITYLRADCPNCGRQWAILPDPERGQDYYARAVTPEELAFVVAGPGAVCPECATALATHGAVITDDGQWLAVRDGPRAVLN